MYLKVTFKLTIVNLLIVYITVNTTQKSLKLTLNINTTWKWINLFKLVKVKKKFQSYTKFFLKLLRETPEGLNLNLELNLKPTF